ncbi:MAG: hypothetical protein LBC12_02940 [Nitrososphaerota archaeon]|nr:hypothetical protein [Nitrososphaerota archaeon]
MSNRVWLFAYYIGCLMAIAAVGFGLLEFSVVLVSVFVSVVLGVVLFWSGFYGGADLKDLLFIALTTPQLLISLTQP